MRARTSSRVRDSRTLTQGMARTITTPGAEPLGLSATSVPSSLEQPSEPSIPGLGARSKRAGSPAACRIGVALAFIFLNSACGGGGDGGDPVADEPLPTGVDLDPHAAAPAYQYCVRVPAAARQTGVRQVREFGAVPDDNRDDTDAIQRALDAMKPGE